MFFIFIILFIEIIFLLYVNKFKINNIIIQLTCIILIILQNLFDINKYLLYIKYDEVKALCFYSFLTILFLIFASLLKLKQKSQLLFIVGLSFLFVFSLEGVLYLFIFITFINIGLEIITFFQIPNSKLRKFNLLYNNDLNLDEYKTLLYTYHSNDLNSFIIHRYRKSYLAISTGLLELLNQNELKSLLYHELGHKVLNHIVINKILKQLSNILLFTLIFCILKYTDIYIYKCIYLLAIISPYYELNNLLLNYIYRRQEYSADSFAAQLTGNKNVLSLLKKINENKPTTKYYFMSSHPSYLKRVKCLI